MQQVTHHLLRTFSTICTRCRAVLVIVGLLAALAGCGHTYLSANSQASLSQARSDLDAGRLPEAERQLSALISANGASSVLSELHYLRGVARQKQGRYLEARQDFTLGATSRGTRQTQVFSAVALANMDFEEGCDAPAISLYRQALDSNVRDLPIDLMLLRLGVALQRQGRWTEADDIFARLISQYPKSPLVPQARQRFEATAFTVQAGLFVDRRNADALAANLRSRNFPVSQSVTLSDNRTAYLVNVGRFRTFDEARATAQRLQAVGVAGVIKP